MKILRIENEQTKQGMWYRSDGTYDPFIMRLTEGKSKHLPMRFHERYSKGGLRWFSGCSNVEVMRQWFSARDAVELHQNGYKLFEFYANNYVKEENQIIFTRESVLYKKELPLEFVWGINELRGV